MAREDRRPGLAVGRKISWEAAARTPCGLTGATRKSTIEAMERGGRKAARPGPIRAESMELVTQSRAPAGIFDPVLSLN